MSLSLLYHLPTNRFSGTRQFGARAAVSVAHHPIYRKPNTLISHLLRRHSNRHDLGHIFATRSTRDRRRHIIRTESHTIKKRFTHRRWGKKGYNSPLLSSTTTITFVWHILRCCVLCRHIGIRRRRQKTKRMCEIESVTRAYIQS